MAPLRRAIFPVLLASALGLSCASAPRRPDGQIGLLNEGADAPDVEAVSADGSTTRLSSLGGQLAVVYFYPRDGTPGCTQEACAFRDAWERYRKAGIAIIGVSSQSRESHMAFEHDHGLPFPLVADEDGTAQRAYGVSKGLFGYSRVSFLVDGHRKIAKVWPDVDPALHANEVLAAAARLHAQ